MYGNGIGTLRVVLHDSDAKEDRTVWSLAGEAGNAWYQGQVPISSFTSFKVHRCPILWTRRNHFFAKQNLQLHGNCSMQK